MINDIRLAIRQLIKSPGFSLVAVLTVGIGISANTTIFSLVRAALLRPLPFPQPGSLVCIANPNGGDGIPGLTGQANFRDWRRLNRSFVDLAAYLPSFGGRLNFTLTIQGEPEKLSCAFVTDNFLDVLGVPVQLGRGFSAEECTRNGPRAIILTDKFWKQRFHSDKTIVGTSITINSLPWTVIGVLPATFDFSSIFAPGAQMVDFLQPHREIAGYDNWGNLMAVVGRLKPGTSMRQAQTEFAVLNQQLRSANPERGTFSATMTLLHQQTTARFRRPLLVLSGAVGCVLLIACANLSNLLLARGAARRRDIAIRIGLGASRWRLVRQILTESVLLSVSGAALGILLAYMATHFLAQSQAFGTSLLAEARVDGVVLAFAILLAVGTGLVFGAVPALQLCNTNPATDLKEMTRGASHGKRQMRAREMLVLSEVALACMLLAGASLLTQSFIRLLEVDPGFRPNQAAAWRIQPNRQFTAPNSESIYYEELLHRVQSLPGIQSASLSDKLPFDLNDIVEVHLKGAGYRHGAGPRAFGRFVHPGYFASMGIKLLSGRDFDARDPQFDWHDSRQKVVIINKAMAEEFWPRKDPLGEIIVMEGPPDPPAECKVIGVVGNVRQTALEQAPNAELYVVGAGGPYLLARTKGRLDVLLATVNDAIRQFDPTMAPPKAMPLRRIIDFSVAPRKLITFLAGLFSLLALLLASLGIYGLVAFSVTQRTREIGIRLALGSSKAGVLRLIIAQNLRLVLAGCGIGVLGALAIRRILESILFGISGNDPATLFLSCMLMIVVALGACWCPALRASRLDPVASLRVDG